MLYDSIVGLGVAGCVGYGVLNARKELRYMGVALGVGYLLGAYQLGHGDCKVYPTNGGGSPMKEIENIADESEQSNLMNLRDVHIDWRRTSKLNVFLLFFIWFDVFDPKIKTYIFSNKRRRLLLLFSIENQWKRSYVVKHTS